MSPATWEAEAEKPAGTSRSFLPLGNKTGVRLAALLTVWRAALPDSLAAVTALTDVLRGSGWQEAPPLTALWEAGGHRARPGLFSQWRCARGLGRPGRPSPGPGPQQNVGA